MRYIGGLLIDMLSLAVIVWATLVICALVSGCATQVAASGTGCPVVGEIQTGTRITCREVIVERASVADSIEAAGQAVGGALRGLLGLPGAPK